MRLRAAQLGIEFVLQGIASFTSDEGSHLLPPNGHKKNTKADRVLGASQVEDRRISADELGA